jgi:hypothetical protein
MSFAIKNGFGNSLNINELDQEAAIFWGVKPDDKWYASFMKKPEVFANWEEELKFTKERMLCNWHDTIGWMIQESEAKDWHTVKAHFLMPYSKHNIEEVISHPSIKPTLDLIAFWEAKGYVPFGTKD